MENIYNIGIGGGFMEYYGTKEASEILGLSQNTISKKCRDGAFPGAEQDAKRSPWRIPKEDIDNYKRIKNIKV